MNRKLTSLIVTAGLASALAALPASVDPKRLAEIHRRLQEFVEAGKTAGVVTLIRQGGQEVSFEAAGYQDLESKTPMRRDTIFQIMSMTKPFTCAGIMILMEEGRLSLTDPVARHLPEFRYQKLRAGVAADGSVRLVDPSRPLTIRDLMTHTSGMRGGAPVEEPGLYRKFDHTVAEVVSMAARQPLEFEPGTRWQYSNVGITTLGRVIEVISHQPYEKFIRDRIFGPLGMGDSCYFLPANKHSRLASLYTYKDGHLVKDPRDIFRRGAKYPMPEGGMYSTARDLARFYQMMLNGGSLDGRRILSPASAAVMTTNHTGDLKAGFQPGAGYGLGWFVVRNPEGMLRLQSIGTFGHGGAFRTYGWVDPAKDLLGVVLQQRTNAGGDMADEISAVPQIAGSAAQ